ncbi:MAG TPA: TIGR01458 family HAD-type hydrolase [Actinomycetota bacterium]|nr:TIGR01458 family HAD-type hydrolase [Actinomycetota bacterium]
MTALAGVKGILLDLDGVLTTSGRPLDGALDAIAWLRTTGMPFKILTNTTTKTRQDLCSQLKESGFDLQVDELLTAATAAADYLRRHHPEARCFLITKSDLSADFEDVEVTGGDADVVVIGGAEDAFTYANLNHAFQMLMNGAVLLAMHRGLYWQTDRGLMLDAGAYVRGLEEAAGVESTLVGKPARSFFDSAVAALGVPAEGIVMVGDNVTSDVNGAQRAGLRGVLVRTGSFRPDQLQRAEREPDAVIDSIGDLPALLG